MDMNKITILKQAIIDDYTLMMEAFHIAEFYLMNKSMGDEAKDRKLMERSLGPWRDKIKPLIEKSIDAYVNGKSKKLMDPNDKSLEMRHRSNSVVRGYKIRSAPLNKNTKKFPLYVDIMPIVGRFQDNVEKLIKLIEVGRAEKK